VVGDVVAGVVGFVFDAGPVFAAVPVGADVEVLVVIPVGVPLPEAGVAAGAETGSDVNGCGSGGRGLAKIPAIISGKPSVVSL
jgi:hypothetical protein